MRPRAILLHPSPRSPDHCRLLRLRLSKASGPGVGGSPIEPRNVKGRGGCLKSIRGGCRCSKGNRMTKGQSTKIASVFALVFSLAGCEGSRLASCRTDGDCSGDKKSVCVDSFCVQCRGEDDCRSP